MKNTASFNEITDLRQPVSCQLCSNQVGAGVSQARFVHVGNGKRMCSTCSITFHLKQSRDDSALTSEGTDCVTVELYRKTCLNQFLKKINEYRQQVGAGVEHLAGLELKCDSHFDTEVLRLNETFKAVQREIQACYSEIYKKLESDVLSNKQELQKSREVSTEILGDLLKTKQDVEENYEKIVLKMDLSPFSEIMDHYGGKMKSIETSLKDLSMYECNLAQLEENKEFLSQARLGLRNLFSLRNMQKATHKKFNSEEVYLGEDRVASAGEKKQLVERLRQSGESPRVNSSPQKKPMIARGFMQNRDSSAGIEARVHQQFRRMTAEIISDSIGTDRALQHEARELISHIDQVVFDTKVEHTRTISSKAKPVQQIKSTQLSKSESSYLRPQTSKEKADPNREEYGSVQKDSFSNRRVPSTTQKKEPRHPGNLKLSVANSIASSKNEDSSKAAVAGDRTPSNQNEKLGKFLKKHFTQSDLKRLTTSKTQDPMVPGSKSKGRLETQRSESKNSEGNYHMKATLSHPHSAKKVERKDPSNSRSDYFTHLVDAKKKSALPSPSPDIQLFAKGGTRVSDQRINLLKRNNTGSINSNQSAKPAISLAKHLSPKAAKEINSAKARPAISRAAQPAESPADKHLETAESALQRIVSMPKNNFVIPKFMKKQPSDAFRRLASARAGGEFTASRTQK